jgi:hypothetical protein
MTYAEQITKLLADQPGLDDDQLAQQLGIEPRQTVNQVCRRLEAQGLLVRERGPAGKIVNRLAGSSQTPARTVDAAPSKNPVRDRQSAAGRSLVTPDITKTLLIIPCSSAKHDETGSSIHGPSILASLPEDLARELAAARQRVSDRAAVNESRLIPARRRYCGALYYSGGQALDDLTRQGAHIIILSGGYGAVLASEPIGMYDAPLKPAWWPNRILERSLIAYAQRQDITCVRAFASATSTYWKVLSRLIWRNAGIDDAVLLSPQPGPGGMRRSPASLGEAIAALRDGTLTTEWQSSYGLALQFHAN